MEVNKKMFLQSSTTSFYEAPLSEYFDEECKSEYYDQMLQGTFNFPINTDRYSKMLLEKWRNILVSKTSLHTLRLINSSESDYHQERKLQQVSPVSSLVIWKLSVVTSDKQPQQWRYFHESHLEQAIVIKDGKHL